MAEGPYSRPAWKKIRPKIIARDGVCQIRGDRCTGKAEDVDHIWSWRIGEWLWYPDWNLRASCKRCNRGRRTELVVAPLPDLPIPDHVTVPPGAVLLCDVTFGTWWLVDGRTVTDVTEKGASTNGEARDPEDW